jgi:hypothetical protein
MIFRLDFTDGNMQVLCTFPNYDSEDPATQAATIHGQGIVRWMFATSLPNQEIRQPIPVGPPGSSAPVIMTSGIAIPGFLLNITGLRLGPEVAPPVAHPLQPAASAMSGRRVVVAVSDFAMAWEEMTRTLLVFEDYRDLMRVDRAAYTINFEGGGWIKFIPVSAGRERFMGLEFHDLVVHDSTSSDNEVVSMLAWRRRLR